MKKFDPSVLKIISAELKSEIFSNKNLKLPLTLFWSIEFQFQDFRLDRYPIYNPMIELGAFTLPFVKVIPQFEGKTPILKSWKGLLNQTFDFTNSFEDNLGFIGYFLKDRPDYEQNQFYDNGIDIIEIKFGALQGHLISTEITLQIDFKFCNRCPPPFQHDWYSEPFTLCADLELKPTEFVNLYLEVQREDVSVLENVIQSQDYHLEILSKAFRVNAQDWVQNDVYQFKPKLEW